jgi:hypothetical protein
MVFLLNLLLIINCFKISETKALTYFKESGEYLISRKFQPKEDSYVTNLVLVGGYKYFISVGNCDDTTPSISVGEGNYINTLNFSNVNDCVKQITFSNLNHSTIIIGIKKVPSNKR